MLVEFFKAEDLIVEVSESARGVCVEGITDNSKQAENESLFICKGAAFKAEYLEEAIDRGTVAYLSEIRYTESVPYLIVRDIRRAMAVAGKWFYDFAGDALTKVGVTGTKGKTTCVTILSDVLRAQGREVAEFTTHSIRLGLRERESALTTPEPLELQKYFREAGQMTNVYADRVVITEQDSGSEHPAKIGSEIARYVHKPCKIVPRREAAIRYILDKSAPGDVIVLTGKGAEKTLRVVRNSVRPYAGDLEIVKAWLRTDMTIDAK